MGEYRCGCSGTTFVGDFMPGHDQTLRSRLAKEVGGLLVMEQLVIAAKQYTAGHLTGQEFVKQVRRLMSGASGK